MADNKKRLQQIRERLDGATPGKWELYPVGNSDTGGIGGAEESAVAEDPEMSVGDWVFLGHSRADVEFLLDLVDNSQSKNSREAEIKYEAAISALKTARMFFEELPAKYLKEAADTLEMIDVALEELEQK
jgi:hypothetical protein